MMDLLNTKSYDLYYADQSYLERTFDQIQRDFDMTGISFDRDKNIPKSYLELYQMVLRNIHHLIKQDHSQFKNLLYRIDVSENAIHRKMALNADLKLEEEISKMIIERCLLKVLTREKFSQ